MWDWLLSPVDPQRAHEVSAAVAWHARSMVLGWGVLAPLSVLIARFFKILPGQNWPRELDSQVWWRCHFIGQSAVVVFSATGLAVILLGHVSTGRTAHATLGYVLVISLAAQVLLGLFRGGKGGPTDPAPDGSLHGAHYDMTPWRRAFETLHKALGYAALALGAATILLGLWLANGPNWMWLVLTLWWVALLLTALGLQRRGWAVDTYQAIWGDDPRHPGNLRPAPGWGMRRPGDARDQTKGHSDVRSDRGNRLRGH